MTSPPPNATTTTIIAVKGWNGTGNNNSSFKFKGEMPPYKLETGIRIATTLGSFFLFVLLTLLYKSKCKKHSRDPTPIQTPQPDSPSLLPHPPLFINNHLGQIHPYNHCPLPAPFHHHHPHPAVLLTAANSDSCSEEEEEEDEPSSSSTNPFRPHHSSPQRTTQQLSPPGRSRLQSIDIHVILPTPTISPSNSEHFRNEHRSGSLSSSSYPPTPFPPSHMVDNLKYVDDTSSENIPTNEEQEDSHSLGSDNVFACFEHNFDHVAPPPPPPPPSYSRRVSSVSGYSGLSANVNVAYGYHTSSPQRDTPQVQQHRDSFCSELEYVNDYMEGNSQRRSSSTQTTFSDLQHCLRLSPHFKHNLLLTPQGQGGQRKRSVDAVLMSRAYTLQ